MALRFVQAIACRQPSGPAEPCRQCRSCQQIERQQYADLSIIQAEEDSRDIKIDQVRALQHWLSLAPYEAPYRAALLLNFQDASQSAQNALLKTLEEAPDRAILLLTADSPESLLPTIASRCETLRLHPLPVDEAIPYLESLEGLDHSQARLLAHMAGGRIGYARRLGKEPGEIERWNTAVEQVFHLLGASYRERFKEADRLTHNRLQARENLQQAFQVWLSVWRDVLLYASGSSSPLVNLAYEAELRSLASKVPLEAARQVVAGLESSLQKLDANANTTLLAEVTLLDMPQIK